MRQAGGYPVTGYEEIDSGMVPPPRPEYLSAVSNTHAGNYGEIGEELVFAMEHGERLRLYVAYIVIPSTLFVLSYFLVVRNWIRGEREEWVLD